MQTYTQNTTPQIRPRKPGQPPLTWDKEHSGCSPETGSVRSHLCCFSAALSSHSPPPPPALTDKFFPHCLRGQMSPFIYRLPLTNQQVSTVLMPGRAQGNGRLDLPCPSSPTECPRTIPIPQPPSPTRPLSLAGNWRVAGVIGSMAAWPVSRAERMGPRCLPPGWILSAPTGTDDQTEKGKTGQWKPAEAIPRRALTAKLFSSLLWLIGGYLAG